MRQQLESSGTTADGYDRYDRCGNHNIDCTGHNSRNRNIGSDIRDRRGVADRTGWRCVLHAAGRRSGEARHADLVARVRRTERHHWTHHPVLVAVSNRKTDCCVGRRHCASQWHCGSTERHRLGPRHGRYG